jgi:hypothetical protein
MTLHRLYNLERRRSTRLRRAAVRHLAVEWADRGNHFNLVRAAKPGLHLSSGSGSRAPGSVGVDAAEPLPLTFSFALVDTWAQPVRQRQAYFGTCQNVVSHVLACGWTPELSASCGIQVVGVRGSRDAFRLLISERETSDDKASAVLREAIRHLHSAGPDSAGAFANSLANLRRNAIDMANVAHRWIDAAGQDTTFRWSLVYVLAAVRHDACLDLLRSEALRRPPERTREAGRCELSDSAELVIVMAIRGLEYLAQAGEERAVECLLEVVERQEHKWLREPAARAVVRVRPDLERRVEELLPVNERYVLTLRAATMQDFSVQPDNVQKRASRRRRLEAPPQLPSELQ